MNIDQLTAEAKFTKEIDALVDVQSRNGHQPYWVVHRLEEAGLSTQMTLKDWEYLGEELGYNPGWSWHQFNSAQHVKSSGTTNASTT